MKNYSEGGGRNDLWGIFYTILPLGIFRDMKNGMDGTDIGEESAKNGGFQRVRR